LHIFRKGNQVGQVLATVGQLSGPPFGGGGNKGQGEKRERRCEERSQKKQDGERTTMTRKFEVEYYNDDGCVYVVK